MRNEITDGFEFSDGGRVFACSVEPCRTARAEAWWWFSVSTEKSAQRYAPFRHEPGDTRHTVQARIVAYYDDLLARRAAPATTHHWRSGRPASAGSPQSPAAAGAPAGAPAAGPSAQPVPDTKTA